MINSSPSTTWFYFYKEASWYITINNHYTYINTFFIWMAHRNWHIILLHTNMYANIRQSSANIRCERTCLPPSLLLQPPAPFYGARVAWIARCARPNTTPPPTVGMRGQGGTVLIR